MGAMTFSVRPTGGIAKPLGDTEVRSLRGSLHDNHRVKAPSADSACLQFLLRAKDFFQASSCALGKSSRAQSSAGGHYGGFTNRVVDLAEEPVRSATQLRDSPRVEFRRKILSEDCLQFLQSLREHFDRVVHVKQVLGPIFVVAFLVNKDFLR